METKHSTFINKIVTLSLLALLSILAACSDGDSSSETSAEETVVITNDGAELSVDTDEITVGEVVTLYYNLGGDDVTGTIRWGDYSEDRVRGSGTIRHRYNLTGVRSVSIQIDGSITSSFVLDVSVTPSIAQGPTNVTGSTTASAPVRPNEFEINCSSSRLGSPRYTLTNGTDIEFLTEALTTTTEYYITLYPTSGVFSQIIVRSTEQGLCAGGTVRWNGYVAVFSGGNPSTVTVTLP